MWREHRRMLQGLDAAERMQPWRCVVCSVAVRLGFNDPCRCTSHDSKSPPTKEIPHGSLQRL